MVSVRDNRSRVCNAQAIRVNYSITGTGVMAHIGCLTLHIYESTDQTNWTRVKSFFNTSTSV